MAKTKRIEIDIYKTGLQVFVGTIDEFREWAKEFYKHNDFKGLLEKINEPNSGQASFFYNNSTRSMVIRVPSLGTTPQSIGIVAHEMAHACIWLLNDVGVPVIEQETDECFTYLLEYLMREFYKKDGYEVV